MTQETNAAHLPIRREGYLIRSWQPDDEASLAATLNNIAIWNNVRDALPYPYTLDDAREYIAFTRQKPYPQDFAIEIDGKAAGGIGFVPQTDVERFNAEIGYWIGEAYWNRGIASDAVRVLADYVFLHTAIVRLYAHVYDYNEASMRVLGKAGFRKIGIMQQAAFKNGRFIDLHAYELIKPQDTEEL